MGAESSRQKGGFAGLPPDDALPTRGLQARCGLVTVNLQRGTIEHGVEMTGTVQERNDVTVLPWRSARAH